MGPKIFHAFPTTPNKQHDFGFTGLSTQNQRNTCDTFRHVWLRSIPRITRKSSARSSPTVTKI